MQRPWLRAVLDSTLPPDHGLGMPSECDWRLHTAFRTIIYPVQPFVVMIVKSSKTDAGSGVARLNKARAPRSSTPAGVKSMLGVSPTNSSSEKKIINLTIGAWNVRTMMDRNVSYRPERRTALIARELSRYGIDIAALSETRLANTGKLIEVGAGYTFYWCGKKENEQRVSGVGFAIKSTLVRALSEAPVGVNDRLMKLRVPLTGERFATVLSVYAPTMDNPEETKEMFYDALAFAVKSTPDTDKLVVLGDFNARVGRETARWPGVIGTHGVGKMNSNGLRLLSFCSEHQLAITNTMFRLADKYKTTWMHPRSKKWHLIDYVCLRQRDVADAQVTRVMRGAECDTDHRLLRTQLRLRIRPPTRRQAAQPPAKLDVGKLNNESTQQQLSADLDAALAACDFSDDIDVDTQWKTFRDAAYGAALNKLGKLTRRHQDWFDENDEELQTLIRKKNAAYAAMLRQHHATRSIRGCYTAACQALQRKTRQLKNQWVCEKAAYLQQCFERNDMKNFYDGLKVFYGPQPQFYGSLKSKDGSQLLTDNAMIMDRWVEHFNDLLNRPGAVAQEALDRIPQRPVVAEMDDAPTVAEVTKAISQLKSGKAPGLDAIPLEVFKHGGPNLLQSLTSLFHAFWRHGKLPQDLKDARVVILFKKGDRSECGNYRGISLLSTAGKILARVLLNRILANITDNVIPESQSGFRAGRGTVDMIFSLRQIQEKCVEQQMPLFVMFIDFTKAFDTVGREGLWELLKKFGCPTHFVSMVRELHADMNGLVSHNSELSAPFKITNGVKQGCALAPTLFSIFLTAALFEATRELDDTGIMLRFRSDGGLFNLARLRAKTKVSSVLIRELLYADDSAFLAHSRDDLQLIADRFAAACRLYGLTINLKKTEVLYQPSPGEHYVDPVITIEGSQLKAVTEFTYLGSTVSCDARLDKEIETRISKACAAFGRLRQRLWCNQHLTVRTKCAAYRAIILSILLYGCESWAIYRAQINRLSVLQMRHLRFIMGLTLLDRVPNEEILRHANMPGIETIIMKAQLRWCGHVRRMHDSRLPKALLYGELATGARKIGRPRLRYKDTIKYKVNRCKLQDWERTALNREQWRSTLRLGAERFEQARLEHQRATRERRRNQQRL